MRHLAAIIAAVLSVTTGGPLRCPCRLATLTTAPAKATSEERGDSGCSHQCGCKSHAGKDVDRQAPPSSPRPEPCDHGPGIDLLAFTAVDRQADDAGGTQLVVPGVARTGSELARKHALVPDPSGRSTSPTSHLRYAHAFRC